MPNKVALVTGGASGMGRATVSQFLDRGIDVIIADLNQAVADKTVAELTAQGADGQVGFIRADVSDEAAFADAVAYTVDRFGGLDILVNAAGVGGAFGPLTEIEVEDWDYTFAVVLRSVFLGIKHAGRVIRKQGRGGAIVNFGSIGAYAAGIGVQPYSVAKAGVQHLTRMASFEFAADRIRVNAVAPGIITTPLIGVGEKELAPVIGTIQPLPYVGLPEYVAHVVVFLASDEAAFITGEIVTVDGGMMAAGPQLGDMVNNNPALRGLVGVNRGSTGGASKIHRKLNTASS
jgi:NAD(P)-dependent dehydrogenase (short-subunit alcohol dehydrogenase family)